MSAVMPVERVRMRPWLENIINDRKYPGVEWIDEDEKTFRLPWKHASRNGWRINTDACLFRAWAEHTGKYQGKEEPNPKIWKANFRCALNSLPDMEEVTEKRSTKGNNAFKIYRILNKTNYSENKKSATKKYKGRHQRKRRSVSRRNSQKDTKPKIKDNTRQLTEEGEPLEVEATNNGSQFTVPAQELCGQHLMDHDYAQTRYFDIYEESGEYGICDDINVPESKIVKTEPRSPDAKKLDECSLYEQESDGNSKKCETQHSSSEGGDKVMSYSEVIELIDELSSECESNGSLDTPMDDFTDDCMDNLSPDFPTRKERSNSAPAVLDADFTNLPVLQMVDINTKSKSLSDLHSIMSSSAQEFLQSCLSGHA